MRGVGTAPSSSLCGCDTIKLQGVPKAHTTARVLKGTASTEGINLGYGNSV